MICVTAMANESAAAFAPPLMAPEDWFVGVTSLAVLLLGTALAMYLGRPSSSKNLPPGPTPLPILGNLLSLGTSPHVALQKLAEKYGPIMTVYFGSTPTVVLSGPEVGAPRWLRILLVASRNLVYCSAKLRI